MNSEVVAAETNPYLPPQAPVADAEICTEECLYVVAPWKFLTLMIGTAGIYSFYWFYKNWTLLNRKHQAYWPVPRAIFAIFFTHSLFEEIDGRIRRGALAYAWSPKALATVYVISALVSGASARLGDRVGDARVVELLNFVLLVPMIFALYRGQLAINVAENDPKGTRNRSLTGANIAWLVLGALWWVLILLGLYLILTGRAPR